jgi:hypothetical protein
MSDVVDSLDFSSLEPIQLPVKIGNECFILREANGLAEIAFQNAINDAIVFQDGKRVGSKNLADVDSLLLSHCIVRVGDNGGMSAVSVEEIRLWPSKIIKKYYNVVRKISEFDDGETEVELIKQKEEIEKKLAALKNGKTSAAKNV